MKNALMVINAYRWGNLWAFDDEQMELVREPFVQGIPEIIDQFVLPEKNTCQIIFSRKKFPGALGHLELIEDHGNSGTYQLAGTEMKGWLCPVTTEYFGEVPKEIWFLVQDK